jgi:hypothetical protein
LFIFFATSLLSNKSYSVLSRGLVKDNSTNLIWNRCSLSDDDEPIYDFNCKGTKKKFNWDEAIDVCKNLVFEGRSDWRLPNIKELQSIMFFHHYSTGNTNFSQQLEEVFPSVVSAGEYTDPNATIHYWSSTPHKNNLSNFWFVDMKYGNTGFSGQDFFGFPIRKYVRCVAGP